MSPDGHLAAGMLATGMDRDKRTRLFIDVGTNSFHLVVVRPLRDQKFTVLAKEKINVTGGVRMD